MTTLTPSDRPPAAGPLYDQLKDQIRPFERPDVRQAAWQIVTSFGAFAIAWWVMWRSLSLPYWVTLALAVPASGFLVRIFIIQHDCGHNSFLPSLPLNRLIGRIASVFTFVPYGFWRRYHAVHHATSGKLDHRAEFDYPTWTVAEYRARGRLARFAYHLVRSPLVLFGIWPLFHFVVKFRWPGIAPRTWVRERRGILWTDLGLVLLWGSVAFATSPRAVLLIEGPIMALSALIGLWLFFIQHQYEHTYWARDDQWSFHDAGLAGSSWYDLPPLLRWFTGHVGLHHVHHLSALVPNYHLQRCLDRIPALQHVPRLTFRESLRCPSLKLWDEEQRRLVRFSDL